MLFLCSYRQPTTHNRSQEHTPRRQEHAATPLERGFRSKAEERKEPSFDHRPRAWTRPWRTRAKQRVFVSLVPTRSQTRSSQSTNHYSLITKHGFSRSQERRVKRWRGVSTDLVRPSYLLPFRESVPLKRVISFRFHLLPHQTVRADFPHTAFLYTSPQGLWDLSSWECFLSEIPYLVIIVDSSDFD